MVRELPMVNLRTSKSFHDNDIAKYLFWSLWKSENDRPYAHSIFSSGMSSVRSTLARNIAWILVAKVMALALIYGLFFAPSHRIDASAHVAQVLFASPSAR